MYQRNDLSGREMTAVSESGQWLTDRFASG